MRTNVFSSVLRGSQRLPLVPDDVGLTALELEPDYGHSAPGSEMCAGNLESSFSILIKFKAPSERYAVTFLNITSPDGLELAVTIDSCSNNITVSLNQRCGLTQFSLPYQPSALRSGWNKLSLSISPDMVQLFINCQPQQAVPIDLLEGCHVQCEDSVVTVLHPAAESLCSRVQQPVSYLPLYPHTYTHTHTHTHTHTQTHICTHCLKKENRMTNQKQNQNLLIGCV